MKALFAPLTVCLLTGCLLTGGLLPGAALAQGTPAPGTPARGNLAQSNSGTPTPANEYRISDCVISLIDQVDIPAREPGIINSLLVREGAIVEADAELGRIDDRDTKTRLKAAMKDLEIARAESENEASVKAAVAMEEVAKAEYNKTKEIDDTLDDAVSFFELERLRLTWVRAGFQAIVAGIEKHMSELQLEVRAAQLEGVQNEVDRRLLKSPMSGFIAQRYRNVGEWVNAGDPVFRLVHMDRLRVEGMVHSSELTPSELLGQPVTIIVDLERGRKVKLQSQISMASPVVQASGHFLIFAEFDNPRFGKHWPVRPGLDAEIIIEMKDPR